MCFHHRKEARAVGPHIGVCCTDCDHFFKWLPQPIDSEKLNAFTMPIGKHKGKRLAQIPVDYLVWAVQNISGKSINRHITAYLESIATSDVSE